MQPDAPFDAQHPRPPVRCDGAPLLVLVMRFCFWASRNTHRRAEAAQNAHRRAEAAQNAYARRAAPGAASVHLPVASSPIGFAQCAPQDLA